MTGESVPVTIYHDPACGTSRNTLALIRNAGVEPDLDRSADAHEAATPEFLREKGTPLAELGLAADRWSDDELVDHMLAQPILINRPIVVTPWGVRLGRPSEVVLEILPLPQKGAFTKQDGERVMDERGQRVRGSDRGPRP
jgi:arsenate reductase